MPAIASETRVRFDRHTGDTDAAWATVRNANEVWAEKLRGLGMKCELIGTGANFVEYLVATPATGN